MGHRQLKLGVLASGSGRTLQNFLDLNSCGELPARVVVVIGSREGLGALEKASTANVPHFVVDRRSFHSAEAFSNEIFSHCDSAGVDLVCFAGWLCLLGIPERYRGRVMNIHPALLPSFGGKGMYGHHVHQAVIDQGCKVSGCTVHFVNEEYDRGPIILQRVCEVREDDDAETLAARVFEEEKIAYPEAIRLFTQGRLKIEGRRVRISDDAPGKPGG
jgi:phosphoribosylglycinamide formyltransferase-1